VGVEVDMRLKRYYTVREVAAIFDITHWSVNRMINTGRLGAEKHKTGLGTEAKSGRQFYHVIPLEELRRVLGRRWKEEIGDAVLVRGTARAGKYIKPEEV